MGLPSTRRAASFAPAGAAVVRILEGWPSADVFFGAYERIELIT